MLSFSATIFMPFVLIPLSPAVTSETVFQQASESHILW